MFYSRLHATNGLVSLAIDALNGEILEFIYESTGENVIKNNYAQNAWSPFMFQIPTDTGFDFLHPPRFMDIQKDSALTPAVSITQNEKSALVNIHYPYVMCKDKKEHIAVDVSIALLENDLFTQWHIEISNHEKREIERVLFPCINGMWLSDSWETNQLVLPHNAGLKVKNPVHALSTPPPAIEWKWQEYKYFYNLGGPYGQKDARNSHVLEYRYSGSCSMLYTDLFDEKENMGVYMTCRNQNFLLKGIHAETFGDLKPGIGLSILHFPCIQTGKTWKSETCIVALHEGDWHFAADDYRTYRNSLPTQNTSVFHPKWFEQSPGLVAHYDFQYQGGGIVHRFSDIERLYDEAKAMGMHHLLLSGWHIDGFDNGFPMYRPNPNLGTEEELKTAIQHVKAQGGHIAFYINSRLCNTKYEEKKELMDQSTIMLQNKQLKIEQYGAFDCTFACLCNQTKAWQEELTHTVDYLTNVIGADSMYLDQLAMASGELCYHPAHKEHQNNPAGWNQGYQKILQNMRENATDEGVAMLYEGVSDIHGAGVSGQLISSMFSHYEGGYPELYKYTFPEQILVDMMNPRRHSAMRAEHLARKSTFLLHKAFVIGSYLWVYDLEMDNTFRRDKEQLVRLQQVCALRTTWLLTYGQGTFKDTYFIHDNPNSLLVKSFEIQEGLLLPCSRENVSDTASLCVLWPHKEPACVFAQTASSPNTSQPISYTTTQHAGNTYLTFDVLKEELQLIVLQKKQNEQF